MTLHTFARGMSTQLKLEVRGRMKTNFSFKVIFIIPGNELANSVKAFLVLCFISLLFFYKKYRVPQVPRVPQVLQVAQGSRSADPKFSNIDLS